MPDKPENCGRVVISSRHLQSNPRLFKFSGVPNFEKVLNLSHQELSINGPVLWRAEVGQQGGHLVERPPANGLGVARRRQIFADFFLIFRRQRSALIRCSIDNFDQAISHFNVNAFNYDLRGIGTCKKVLTKVVCLTDS